MFCNIELYQSTSLTQHMNTIAQSFEAEGPLAHVVDLLYLRQTFLESRAAHSHSCLSSNSIDYGKPNVQENLWKLISSWIHCSEVKRKSLKIVIIFVASELPGHLWIGLQECNDMDTLVRLQEWEFFYNMQSCVAVLFLYIYILLLSCTQICRKDIVLPWPDIQEH